MQGLAHAVFFTLKDSSEESCERMAAACHEYLDGHPGVVHFSAGKRAEAYARPVNDQEFHVALIVVFESQTAHDQYQTSPRHQKFIAEQSPHWARVRVFDALI
ncbi:MAG TPA: Dabb family protein [Lacipirellulaceae bacterium]|mgnify:CR=1 FL=1|nr:Dabb family protein [Lacipirellulaceae bacterium]HMP05798.1 Dabb family protein [Lacipirellulaceae bacterium]